MSKKAQLPSYSQYEYADVLPLFCEHDRIGENEIATLICSDCYTLELHSNQLTDDILNDYLYMLYQKKGLETSDLIRKLVVFFVRRYHDQLLPRVQTYLETKKLTLEEWLNAVKNE